MITAEQLEQRQTAQASECYIADDIAAKEALEKLQYGEWDLWSAVIWLRSKYARNYQRICKTEITCE